MISPASLMNRKEALASLYIILGWRRKMRKFLTLGLLSLFVLGLLVSPGSSQDAKKVLEKVIEAQGGRKALESIKDSTSKATMDLTTMGMSGDVAMYMKEPNMVRMDMEFMGMAFTQAYDGETAWMINPQTGGAEVLPEELAAVIKAGAYGNSAFLEPEKYGITYSLKGKENIKGKDYLILERAYEDGYVISFYIDPDTYLIYKTKQDSYDEMMSEVVEEAVLSDYKKVNGVMTAHTLTILRDGAEFGIITLTEVLMNTGLEDSFFKMN
jgi:outer membrane lipoprotein-sorting protein